MWKKSKVEEYWKGLVFYYPICYDRMVLGKMKEREQYDTSLKFHLKVGFEEANRIICFTKKL